MGATVAHTWEMHDGLNILIVGNLIFKYSVLLS